MPPAKVLRLVSQKKQEGEFHECFAHGDLVSNERKLDTLFCAAKLSRLSLLSAGGDRPPSGGGGRGATIEIAS